ncbi:unnamed protein product, partial [Penicillium discolor]
RLGPLPGLGLRLGLNLRRRGVLRAGLRPPQGRVAVGLLPEHPEPGGCEVGGGGAPGAFDDHHGIIAEQRSEGGEVAVHRLIVDVVRRIREHEVVGPGRAAEERSDRRLLHPCGRGTGGLRDGRGVAPHDGCGLPAPLDEVGALGAAAQRLEPERPRARVEVEHAGVRDRVERLQGAEQGFAHAVARGSGPGAGDVEPGAACRSGDDPRHPFTIRQAADGRVRAVP